jgi:hypothetical protein
MHAIGCLLLIRDILYIKWAARQKITPSSGAGPDLAVPHYVADCQHQLLACIAAQVFYVFMPRPLWITAEVRLAIFGDVIELERVLLGD